MSRWVFVCVSLFASVARADHVLTELGLTPTSARSTLRISAEALAFNHSGGGSGQIYAVEGDLAFTPWLSLGARIPFARLARNGMPAVLGVADSELRGRLLAYATEHDTLRVELGLALELPTGDLVKALSGGHVAFSPAAAVSWAPSSSWVTQAVVGLSMTLGSHHHDTEGPPGALLSPHHPREVFLRAEAVWIPSLFFAAVGLEVIEPLDVLSPFIAPGGSVGLRTEQWQLRARGQAPVFGTDRYSWKTGLELVWTPR